jgi:hypothetical protein
VACGRRLAFAYINTLEEGKDEESFLEAKT